MNQVIQVTEEEAVAAAIVCVYMDLALQEFLGTICPYASSEEDELHRTSLQEV